jgi:hypothetical protein
MSGFRGSLARTPAVMVVALACLAPRAGATGVPIGGFFPMVGIALTDEFDDDFNTYPVASSTVTGELLGAGGVGHYDVALLDTGAAVSLLTSQAFDDFGLGSASPGESDGYRGTESVGIGGATGTLTADINDPLGLYVGGLQGRGGTSPLTMIESSLRGQTNTSMITLPVESDLPNVVGLSYAGQYATYIRNDQPQIFTLNGRTVRSPSIEFVARGSGGQGITRRAPLSLNPGESFAQPPSWLYNVENFDIENPQENPSLPTIIQGGLFLNVNLANDASNLTNSSFFFDTGADVSVLSELTALQLGIDVVLDAPDFTVAVIGSGGTKQDVPGFYLDSFTIQAVGGSVTATNVPVIVLDVADPSNSANIVPGIVGTNMLAGRNVVIDPNPALGGGGASPSLYISDPVTTETNWSVSSSSGNWWSQNWSQGVPNLGSVGPISVANVRHVAGGNQEVRVNDGARAWEVNVSGAGSEQQMTLRVANNLALTTFAGINIEAFGTIQLEGGRLDAQYVEILGGTLAGNGSIMTGSGPIDGQVENRNGVVAPGVGVGAGTLSITGRFANGHDGALNIELGGLTAGTQYDRLLIDGVATLDGTLNVSLVNLGGGMFAPALGNVFSIIMADSVGGTFSTLNLPSLTSDKMWFVGYEETSVLLKVTLPGDFDGDGGVDDDDLAVWKNGYGSTYGGDGFLSWQRYFGQSIGAIAAVPEPAAGALITIGLAAIALRRRTG